MFRVHWRTDEDIAAIIPQCSAMDAVMLEVLSACNLTPSSNKHNRMVIYAPKPLPRVYIMPCEAILGKLPVVPFGDTGTFNAKLPAEWFDSDARRDTPGRPGTGSEVWSVNTWSLEWAKDCETVTASDPQADSASGPAAGTNEEESGSDADEPCRPTTSDNISDEEEDAESCVDSDS